MCCLFCHCAKGNPKVSLVVCVYMCVYRLRIILLTILNVCHTSPVSVFIILKVPEFIKNKNQVVIHKGMEKEEGIDDDVKL